MSNSFLKYFLCACISLWRNIYSVYSSLFLWFSAQCCHTPLHSGPGFIYVHLFTSADCVLCGSGRCTHAKSHTWRPEDSAVQLLLFFCVYVVLEIAFRPPDLCGTHFYCWFACHVHLETESYWVARSDFEPEILLSLSSEHRDDRCAPKSRSNFYCGI